MLRNLQKSGVSIDKLTRGTQIKKFNLRSESTYLPIQVLYGFLEHAQQKLGVANISSLYLDFDVKDLDDYGMYLATCPDLYTVVLGGIKYDHQLQNNGQLKLEINGSTAYFYMTHFDPPSFARQLSEQIELTMMLEAFHMIAGRAWKPLSISLTTKDDHWLEDIFEDSDFVTYTEQPYVGFTFKTEDLNLKNPMYRPREQPRGPRFQSRTHLIEEIMSGTTKGFLPSLEEFSHYFGVSRRTLIRDLAQEGTSFTYLLQKNLQSRSLDLLKDHRLQIKDVADRLGYANTPNFVRAFKQWTNMTPGQFRLTL